jgi:superfamily II DNA or RNA helicase
MATAAARGKTVLMLVHRQELLDQASATLHEHGVAHGIIAAGVARARHPVQLASIATVARRLDRLGAPDFIFVDEFHHAASASWSRILERWHRAYVLGFTATPQRLDGKGLARYADALVCGPDVRALIAAGHLADYRLYAPPGVSVEGLATRAGDYARDELAAAVDRPEIVGDVAEHYQRLAPGKRAVVFAVTREHARHLAEALRAGGVDARYVGGDTERHERRALLAEFGAGRVQALCSVDILGEGLDVPGIEAVVCARPTRSLTLCLQQWGRGLRPKPDGSRAVILDHAGNCRRHGLPDDARHWELAADRPRRPPAPTVSLCPKCFAVFATGPAACPECGFVLVAKPRLVKEVAGTLAELERGSRRSEQRTASDYASLVALGRQRGYRHPEGWARHVMAARGRRQ